MFVVEIFSLCSIRRLRTVLIAIALIFVATAQSADVATLEVYSYISPPAATILNDFGISAAEIEDFARKGLESRAIGAIDPDQLHKGYEDAFRIDIRKKKNDLLLELSVRQGGSIHNMLERWSNRCYVSAGPLSDNFRRDLFISITVLLDDLKLQYTTADYRRGRMMPEDFTAESDE
jgi:hypothetical protein